jgi:hypothetical protein
VQSGTLPGNDGNFHFLYDYSFRKAAQQRRRRKLGSSRAARSHPTTRDARWLGCGSVTERSPVTSRLSRSHTPTALTGWIRSAAHCAGHDEDRGALPTRRSLERPTDRAVSVDPPVHLTVEIPNRNRRPIRRRVRSALVGHREPKQAGYYALGRGGQLIIVLPKSRAVIVYLTDVQPDSEIDGRDLAPLDNVLISAFPPC